MKLNELLSCYEGDDEYLSDKATIYIQEHTYMNTEFIYEGSANKVSSNLMNKNVWKFYILDGKLNIIIE